MPAETLTTGSGASPEDVRRAVYEAIEEVGLGEPPAGVDDDTDLELLNLADLALLDVVEIVAAEVGERSMANIDGAELDECRTVGDLIWLCADRLARAPRIGAGAGGDDDDR